MSDAYSIEEFSTRKPYMLERKNGVGASEASAIWNVSPYTSEFGLYVSKMTDDTAKEEQEKEWLEIGCELEEPIARLYAKRRKVTLEDPGRTTIYRSKRWPWMFASLDRVILGGLHKGPGVLECKNRSAFALKEWDEDRIPLDIQLQVQHQLAVTGYRWGSVACLIGGNRFLAIDVERNNDLIEAHVARCEAFVHRIEMQEPPPVDGSQATTEALKALYPREVIDKVDLPQEAEQWASERQAAKEMIKLAEGRIREAENWLKAAIGSAAMGVLPSGSAFSLKTVERKAYEVKATSYRELRAIKEKK